MIFSDIGHDQRGKCNERPKQCLICPKAYKSENYACKVTEYKEKKGKICIYVVPKSVSCSNNYQSNVFKCPTK